MKYYCVIEERVLCVERTSSAPQVLVADVMVENSIIPRDVLASAAVRSGLLGREVRPATKFVPRRPHLHPIQYFLASSFRPPREGLCRGSESYLSVGQQSYMVSSYPPAAKGRHYEILRSFHGPMGALGFSMGVLAASFLHQMVM